MREILFRGKRADNEKWEYGLLVKEVDLDGHDELCIQTWRRDNEGVSSRVLSVIPGTVSQYTGVSDKNGTKIFEGDICRNIKTNEVVYVKWHGTMAGYVWSRKKEKNKFLFDLGELFRTYDKFVVVGNIYDNPELFEGACEQCQQEHRQP